MRRSRTKCHSTNTRTLIETLLLLWSSSAAISSKERGRSERYSRAKMRPCCWERIPEVAEAAPIPSTKLATALDMLRLPCGADPKRLAAEVGRTAQDGGDDPESAVVEEVRVHLAEPQCQECACAVDDPGLLERAKALATEENRREGNGGGACQVGTVRLAPTRSEFPVLVQRAHCGLERNPAEEDRSGKRGHDQDVADSKECEPRKEWVAGNAFDTPRLADLWGGEGHRRAGIGREAYRRERKTGDDECDRHHVDNPISPQCYAWQAFESDSGCHRDPNREGGGGQGVEKNEKATVAKPTDQRTADGFAREANVGTEENEPGRGNQQGGFHDGPPMGARFSRTFRIFRTSCQVRT